MVVARCEKPGHEAAFWHFRNHTISNPACYCNHAPITPEPKRISSPRSSHFTPLNHGSHSRVSPSAHRIKLMPALTVSATLPSTSGLTSTKSTPTHCPVSATASQMKFPSLNVNPPLTGIPVLGAHMGSNASTSRLI